MSTKTFKRGDFVRYTGSITRYRGTWWTVEDVLTSHGSTSYTLHTVGIGRLRNVRSTSVDTQRVEA
ncbi:hypothetical protein [Streptomyces griseorubiginosus]|uniref:hypothetical protein n=1 Tax=Streptomyces griseorubiginosus TaxID=67304 RepID=UPI0033E0FEFF